MDLWFQLSGTVCDSTIAVIEKLQSKILRAITTPRGSYTKIVQNSGSYMKRFDKHPRELAINILDTGACVYGLKIQEPLDLPYRLYKF